MNYSIKISGGFTGIQQEFSGEINATEEKKAALKKIFTTANQIETNKNLRDAFNYNIQLEIDSKQYIKSFDDMTIPKEVIELIDEIKKNKDL